MARRTWALRADVGRQWAGDAGQLGLGTVYDYGRANDGSFYYVMEYLDGPTLEELVRQSGPLPPGRVVYLLRQVCGALSEAHASGLVHRDLKPGNLIVASLGGQKDVAKLLDFGLVQDLSVDADVRLTQTGTVLGTPAYMSPEQAAGESSVDGRGDGYSLGAVAYFALTGRPPFQGKSFGQILAAHRSEPPPPLNAVRPDVPADLAAVVARCLAKDPGSRYQTAAELDRALAACACAANWSAEHAAEWWQRTKTPNRASAEPASPWACRDGQPWKVGIGLFMARGAGKPRDLETKLASLGLEPPAIDHLILLRPDDDVALTGKSKTAWQDAEKRGARARLEATSLDAYAILYGFPRWLTALRESLPAGQSLPNLADLIQDQCEKLLEQICMPVGG